MTRHYFAYLLLAVIYTALGQRAFATTILYEGFGDYSLGNLAGQDVGASTIGLDKSTTWQSNNEIVWDVVAESLTIGSGATTLQTANGAVIKRSQSSVLAAKLDVSNYVGTLYSSYLYSMDLSQATGAPNQAVFAVIGEGTENTSGRRFRQLARANTSNSSPVGVNYINGATAGNGEVNTSQTTFMILSRFTRVGESVDVTTPGVATLWALNSDQFDHFKSTGFADIDSAEVGTSSTQVTGMATHTYAPEDSNVFSLDSSLHLQLASGMARSIFIAYDEIRMGDSFTAVTQVVGGDALLGDYNSDGIVDAADYTIWRDNFGGDGAALGPNRDPANTGVISEADYDSWKSSFGQTLSGDGGLTAPAVPEPGIVSCLVGAITMLSLRCGRSR